MLDKRKIRLMTRAAIYDKTHGETDLKITGYYQKDYVSLNVWITLIWMTVGYGLAGILFFACCGESLIEGITIARMLIIAAVVLAVYLSMLVVFAIGAGAFYKKRHTQAKQRVKKYMRDLSRMEKMNHKKEIHKS